MSTSSTIRPVLPRSCGLVRDSMLQIFSSPGIWLTGRKSAGSRNTVRTPTPSNPWKTPGIAPRTEDLPSYCRSCWITNAVSNAFEQAVEGRNSAQRHLAAIDFSRLHLRDFSRSVCRGPRGLDQGRRRGPGRVGILVWYNPFMKYRNYIPAILVLLMTVLSGFISALNIVREKGRRNYRTNQCDSAKKMAVCTGKMIPFLVNRNFCNVARNSNYAFLFAAFTLREVLALFISFWDGVYVFWG